MPGGVDAHVHFAQDFNSGMCAAQALVNADKQDLVV
jgi:cytosine/adenosine deaminase-related metal-dependent hydrolase